MPFGDLNCHCSLVICEFWFIFMVLLVCFGLCFDVLLGLGSVGLCLGIWIVVGIWYVFRKSDFLSICV